MQFIRIHNISDLKIGDKLAITTSDKNLKDLIGSNVNLTTGTIIKIHPTAVSISTNTRDILLSNLTMKIQAVYLIIDSLSMGEKDIQRDIKLERKLRKSEKLNRRYKAILTKKFNITEEDLKTNLKPRKTKARSDEFFTYKCLDMELPYVLDGKPINLPAICSFRKSYGRSDILCTITAYHNDKKIAIGEGKAICHPEDEHDEQIGELIASTKALKDITCKLY